ncbi:MAG: ABC transporter ATP-binding protein [Thermoleophilaceae bacterium]
MSFEALELREQHPDEPMPVRALPDARDDSDSAPPLDLLGVHKTWGRKRKQKNPVLRGVDLTLEPGSLTWIGGRNGAGKTTLLRVASGLIGADKGYVLSYGLDPLRDRREFQRRVAFLSAGNTGLYARLTVRIQVDTWARINFLGRDERTAAVERALEAFDLMDLAEARCDRISMGQRQRVRLAMTFVGQPDLVLLDEPGTSLDDAGHAVLREAIGGTVERGGAVLWVSPSGDQARAQADFTERFVLEDGKLSEL